MVLMKPNCTWLVTTFVREHNIRCKLRGARDIDKILKMVCVYHKNIKCIRISHMRNEENDNERVQQMCGTREPFFSFLVYESFEVSKCCDV